MKYDVQLERECREVRLVTECTECEVEASSREEAEAKINDMLEDPDFNQDFEWEWLEVDYDTVASEIFNAPKITEIQEAGE